MRLLIIIVCCLFCLSFAAQTDQPNDSLTNYNAFWKTNKNGMIALTSWSALNISSSILLRNRLGLEASYLNQMNGFWNVINLTLGVPGIIKSYRMLKNPDLSSWSVDQLKLPKIYKTNFFIDFGYIGAGVALTAFSDRFKNPHMASGYGKSIIFQGAYLLVFDYVMFKLLQKKASQ